jgi:4-aminobutyrate aminotransferase-like enzyme
MWAGPWRRGGRKEGGGKEVSHHSGSAELIADLCLQMNFVDVLQNIMGEEVWLQSKMAQQAKLFQGVKHLLPNYIVKSGAGSYVSTQCGRRLLDFACGIGVTNLGHCHPKVTQAVQKAVGEVVHAQQNIMRHENMVTLTDRLANLEISKKSKFDSWFFWNSGAEAGEACPRDCSCHPI